MSEPFVLSHCDQSLARSRRAVSGLLLTILMTGVAWMGFAPDAHAYQVKRVIRGSVNLGTTTEVTTLDLNDPNGDLNPIDSLLLVGGVSTPLIVAKTFVVASLSINSNDRRRVNVMVEVDTL